MARIKLWKPDTAPIGEPDDTFRYLPLTDQKSPKIKFKDDGGLPWGEVSNEPNVGLVLPRGVVVLDFDEEQDCTIMRRIVKEKGLRCRIIKTERGMHFYFRTTKLIRGGTKINLHIGISADIKRGASNEYVIIRKNGRDRKIISDVPFSECDVLPKWLEPSSKDSPRFLGMTDGDGRNESLSPHLLRMQRMGLSVEECKTAADIINRLVFADPLTQREFDTIVRDDTFLDDNELAQEMYFDDKGNFLHDVVARALVDRMSIVSRGNTLYVYDEHAGFYVENCSDVERGVIAIYPRSKRTHRMEVVDYISRLQDMRDARTVPEGDEEFTVNVKNGRLNLRTGRLSPHTPEALDFQQIPVEFNPDARCPLLDQTISRVLMGDAQLEQLFNQILGYTLMRTSRYDKFFIFTGGGANGKSTILNMMGALVGETNMAALSLQQLEDRFTPAGLEDKLVNIGDDIGTTAIANSSTLKKVVSGEKIQVERKGIDGYMMTPYCTLIYSANDIPHIADNSDGLKRRMVILPFDYKFDPRAADYNPDIEDDLTTDQALSTLLNRAVKGAQQIIANKGFRNLPPRAVAAQKAFNLENSSILAWADDVNLDNDYLKNMSKGDVYQDYLAWCEASGLTRPMSIIKFGKRLKQELGLIEIRDERAKRWEIPDHYEDESGQTVVMM